jgi:hypothetical protein
MVALCEGVEENCLIADCVDSRVNRDEEATGDANEGIDPVGRIASRLKLDVKAIKDRVEAILNVCI